jgi:hypothetical protein
MWSSWSSELREHFEFGRNRSSACAPTGIVALQTMLAHPFTEKGNQARCLWISWRWKLRLQPALRRGVASLNGRHIYGEATTHPDGFRHQTLGIGFTDRAKSRSDSTGWPGLLEAKLPIA